MSTKSSSIVTSEMLSIATGIASELCFVNYYTLPPARAVAESNSSSGDIIAASFLEEAPHCSSFSIAAISISDVEDYDLQNRKAFQSRSKVSCKKLPFIQTQLARFIGCVEVLSNARCLKFLSYAFRL